MNTQALASLALFSGALIACGGSGPAAPGPNNTNTAADAGTSGGAPDAGTSGQPDSGASGGVDAGPGSCEDVSGAWSPTGLNTCVAPGDTCTLTQSGCQVDLRCDNGAFSVAGEATGGQLELENGANRCTAIVTGDRMRADCQGPDILNGSCSGDFVRGTSTDVTEVDGEATCSNADWCTFRCSQGTSCQHTCEDSARCDTTCSTGGCHVTCSGDAECDSGCSGGGCLMTCEGAADCDFGCSGGGCTFVCNTTGVCDTSCTGGGCAGG